ncbi:MAG: ATP-binding protein [Muribaculaceae bacterium]|nr:ATP-binding protein [Muribaculaceae bacterium]
MIENPFIITEKVIPHYFCDRKEESARLIDLLKNGNNVVLISPRRIGKTGLIQYCFDKSRVQREYITFYLDILSTTDLKEFTFMLGNEVYNVLQKKGKKLVSAFLNSLKSLSGKLGFDPFSGTPTLSFQLGDITHPEYTLKEIFSFLASASKPCIVAIDEFQQVVKYPEQNVEALIRSHILQINNCRFIFSGSEKHILEEMFLSPARPFYQSCTYMSLEVIPEEDYVKFIRDMFKEGGRDMPEELARKVYRMFEGHTFYIQRVCNALYNKTPKAGTATEENLKNALDEIFFSYDLLFRARLSRISVKQKELLFAVAKERRVENPTSLEFIRRNSLTSASSVQAALRALIKDDIIIKDNEGCEVWDKFFAMWIRRNYVN